MFLGSTPMPMPMPIMIPTPSGGSGEAPFALVIVLLVVLAGLGWFLNFVAYSMAELDCGKDPRRKPALVIGVVPYLLAVVVIIWGGVSFFVSQWRKG